MSLNSFNETKNNRIKDAFIKTRSSKQLDKIIFKLSVDLCPQGYL